MKRCVLLCLLAIGICGNKKLTLADVTGKSPFETASLGRITWIPDEDAFIVRHDGALKKVDVVSGDTTIFMDSTSFMLSDPEFTQAPWRPDFVPSTFSFSEDGSKILFLSERKQIWRRSYFGTFWVMDAASGEIQSVSKDNSDLRNVKFSPDGSKVAYVRKDNNIYVFNLKSKREKKLTRTGSEVILNGHWGWVYEEEFGSFDGYRWSPDSKSIAYWEEDQSAVPIFKLIHELDLYPTLEEIRYPKAGETNPTMRIGIVSVNGGRTKWLDIGDNYDTYYPWLKWTDYNELIAMQMNRKQNEWTLLTIPVKRGKTAYGLKETDPNGWVSLHRQYHFLENGNILWMSERSGWNHLYINNPDGKQIRRLTSGNWEVTRIVHIDEESGITYFMANKDSVTGSRLYSVDFDGKNLSLLTPEPGMHSVSVTPSGEYFIDAFSSVSHPRKIILKNMDGSAVRVLAETDKTQYEEYGWSLPQFLQFKTQDGSETLDGILTLPPDYKKGDKVPVIVYGYGMPGTQIVRNRWGGLWNQFLAQEGYAVFSMDARGMSGRGEAFKNLAYLDMAKYLAKDTKTGVQYLINQGIVDPDRIGAWGWSGGGYFTGLMLTKNADIFDVGVSVAPVMDFRLYDTIYTERSMGHPKQNKDGYDSTSVLSYVDRFNGKMLVMHGTGDDNVHSQNTVQLTEAFIKAGKQVDTFYYPGRRHGISRGNARAHVYQKMFVYFKENL